MGPFAWSGGGKAHKCLLHQRLHPESVVQVGARRVRDNMLWTYPLHTRSCRYQSWELAVAGIAPVEAAGVENVDISHIVSRHLDYRKKMPDILRMLDLEGRNIPVEDAEFVSAGAIAHRKADGAKSE